MAVFGVDFGTLNSVVAVTRHGGVDVICNEVSKRDTATFVSYMGAERLIGEAGLDKAVRNWQNTVPCVKRLLGLRKGDPRLESELRFVPCNTTFDSEGRLQLDIEYNDTNVSIYPEQVLGAFLGKLKKYVAIETKTDSKDVVVTVPAWYTIEQRKLVIQSCELANLNCLSLINETTASSVDYGIFRQSALPDKEDDAAIVAIIDLGYASTTITVSKFWKGNMRVLAHVWDHELGTREAEWLLGSFFAAEIQKKYNIDVTTNKRAMIRILQACDKLKCMLSANLNAPLNIENLMDVDVNIMYSRDELEKVIAPLCERIRALSALALTRAGVTADQLLAAEVIGGGSRIPSFKAAISDGFGVPASFTLNASESIARGAAITAATFSPLFQVREYVVNEAPLCPLVLGYFSDKSETVSSVSWLPGVNKTMSMLKETDRYPKTIDLTFQRSDEFDLWAFYDETAEQAKHVPSGARSLVGHWKVGGSGSKTTTGSVKVRVRFHANGLVTLDGASTTETYEAEVEEPVKTKEGEEPAADAKTHRVKKPGQKKFDLTVTPQLMLGMPAATFTACKSAEAESDTRDQVIQRTREARNELEAYVYDYRPKVEESILRPFVNDADRVAFVALANQFEEWFNSEESEGAPFQEFQTRLDKLKVIGAAALRRQRLSEDIPFAHGNFEKKVIALKEKAASSRGKVAHITNEEIDGAIAKCDEAIVWGQSELDSYQAKARHIDPTIAPSTFDNKAKEVDLAVSAVLNKKAPPPPKKEEPKKEEASAASPAAPEAEAAPEAPAAGPGTVPVELD